MVPPGQLMGLEGSKIEVSIKRKGKDMSVVSTVKETPERSR